MHVHLLATVRVLLHVQITTHVLDTTLATSLEIIHVLDTMPVTMLVSMLVLQRVRQLVLVTLHMQELV